MEKDTIVIVPAHNEEMNIARVIEELKRDLPQADILIVNDHSGDNTLGVLRQTPDIVYLSLPFNLGYSNAIQTGFKYAFRHHYDYVIQFDGDGQHIASEAGRMLAEARASNADIVIGSRFKAATQYKHGFFRKIGTSLFAWLIRAICHQTITDPTSGLQVINRAVFGQYEEMFGYPEYPDANLLIEMLLRGYKIVEIDVKMRQREFGVSMHSGVIGPSKYMVEMLYSILLLLLRKNSFSAEKKRS
jgi:glycosyltransferase involved in cell wall biosynthesis